MIAAPCFSLDGYVVDAKSTASTLSRSTPPSYFRPFKFDSGARLCPSCLDFAAAASLAFAVSFCF